MRRSNTPDEKAEKSDRSPAADRDKGGGRSRAEQGELHPELGPETLDYYRLLVDSVQDYAIFALDRHGRILTWNAGAERLKGYTHDEIVGRHMSIFYSAEEVTAGKPERELQVAAREGRVEDSGWRVRKDGSRFWANVIITALHNEEGDLVGFAKITRDLTALHEAEELLRESEERFRLLVEGVKDYAIFMLSPEGRIVSWNAGAQSIKGYTPEEIAGRHFSIFYPAADVASGKPARALATAAREGKYAEEGWRVKKDGTTFWASVLITAVRVKGRIIGYAKITRDLTERRAAEERALADARRVAEAEAASRTKSEFLTSMSHELRTPINATLGFVELVEMGVGGPVTEQQSQFLTRIRGSQEHLLRIINDLLNYSQIEGGHLHYESDPVSLDEVIDTVLPMVEPQSRAKGLRLVREACPNGAIGTGDRARIEQIVLNLLANAVKFTPEGGTVTVGCSTTDEHAVIRVTDTGPGVPEAQQKAIFEPFVQVGRSLTSGHEGTGLGLAISRDLAAGMGGDLLLERSDSEGSTFLLRLLANKAQAQDD